MNKKPKLYACVIIFAIFALSYNIYAVPPHPRLLLQQFDIDFKYMMNVMRTNKSLRDMDIPKEGYKPSPDGVEYVLAIRIDFSDQPGQKNATVFNEALFGTRGTSMRLYFEEISYGNMHVLPGYLGGVTPGGQQWYRARKPMSYYGEGNIMADRYKELAVEACMAADPDVDFSRYDRNGDGFVDHLMIIHSGDDEASTGVSRDIWSAVVDEVSGIYDGVRIASVMLVAEDPSNDFINVGIYAHEFFHEFGAPDLYSWDYPVGHWCLMGTFGPYQDDGRYPSHISGYLKWDFDANRANGIVGWLEPIELTSHGTYSVDSLELPVGDRLYKIDIPGKRGREYFLLENRNKRSGAKYDTYLPESGIVIWHIDEEQSPFFGNPHRAWVEDPTDPEHDDFRHATEGAAYSADDGQTAFTVATKPNSKANDGTDSGIIITDISAEGMSMSFTLFSGDTYEPNNSIANSYGPLDYGRNYISFIQTERDVDFYRFHVDSDSNMLIYLEDIPEYCDYDLRVFDARERLIADSTDQRQKKAKVLSFKTHTPGIYYVSVSSTDGYRVNEPYSIVVDSVPLAPGMITVSKVYPNPGPGSAGAIRFKYALLAPAENITLEIYTLNGNLIHSHSSSDVDITGELIWDATNNSGQEVASGLYVYLMRADLNGETDIQTGKIAVVY
jgi:M6 family metalloprotease-like protein